MPLKRHFSSSDALAICDSVELPSSPRVSRDHFQGDNDCKKAKSSALARLDSLKSMGALEIETSSHDEIKQLGLSPLFRGVATGTLILFSSALNYFIISVMDVQCGLSDDATPSGTLLFVPTCLCAVAVYTLLRTCHSSVWKTHMYSWILKSILIIAIAAVPLASIGSVGDAKPLGENCAPPFTFSSAKNGSTCLPFNVTEKDQFWTHTCDLVGHKYEIIFISSEVRDKYKIDLNSAAKTYKQAKNLARIIGHDVDKLVNVPISPDVPLSFLDTLICPLIFAPCTEDCIAQVFHANLWDIISTTTAANIIRGGCTDLAEYEGFIQLTGFDGGIIKLLQDAFRGIRLSCERFLDVVLRDTTLESSPYHFDKQNYTRAYRVQEQESGACTEDSFMQEYSAYKKENLKLESDVNKWESRYKVATIISHISMLLVLILCFIWSRRSAEGPLSLNLRNYHTRRSVFCCALLFFCGVVILCINILSLSRIKNAAMYIYAIAFLGCYSIFIAAKRLLFAKHTLFIGETWANIETREKGAMGVIRKLRKKYKTNFGVTGKYFIHAALVKEITEVALQSFNLFRNAGIDDVYIVAASCATILVNCVASPFAYFYRRKDVVIALDGIFDILFTIINAVRMGLSEQAIDFFDAASLILPLISIIDILASYSEFLVKEKANLGKRSRKQSVNSPKTDVPKAHSTIANRAYSWLCFIFAALAIMFSVFSGYTLVRLYSKHSFCKNRYSNCIWSETWPRRYFKNSSIFGDMNCGEMHVESIDASECTSDRRLSNIPFDIFVRLTSLRLGKISAFPKSLAKLMHNGESKMFLGPSNVTLSILQLPQALDLSNLGVNEAPVLLLKLLQEHRNSAVKRIDMSNNNWNSVKVLKVLSSVSCEGNKWESFCNLEAIDASRNMLEDIPSILFSKENFPKLVYLDVQSNEIKPLTSEMVKYMLDKNFVINFTANELKSVSVTGSVIPTSFDTFVNRIDDITSLANVTAFAMSNTSFYGDLGVAVSKFSNLEDMVITYNPGMNGTISSSIGVLSNLRKVFISNSKLKGTIPSQVGLLTNLDVIVIGTSKVESRIPTEIGLLTNANIINIYALSLYGRLPSEIGKLTKLGFFSVRGCKELTGFIPLEINQMTSLTTLDLRANNFTGFIPRGISLLKNLSSALFGANRLTGTIPTTIGELTSLTILELHRNMITGTIPTTVGKLVRLKQLYISSNALKGSIPTQIGYLTNLRKLTLSQNDLTNKTIPWQVQKLVTYGELTYLRV